MWYTYIINQSLHQEPSSHMLYVMIEQMLTGFLVKKLLWKE